MRDFKVGQTVQIVREDHGAYGQVGTITVGKGEDSMSNADEYLFNNKWYVRDNDLRPAEDAVDPDHYKFPGGTEVRQISAHLTSFGGQALQYIARSTRLDGKNKGDSAENLRKAIAFLQWEIERLESDERS